MPDAPPDETYLRRLLHRWFVEYNPLYLFSAVLVLGGTILASRGLAHEGSLYGEVGVAAIAELYAAALIGGAALLMKLGQKRGAVMLALLVALYQCDVTLHTETCPNLGVIGALGTIGWLAFFVAKLAATGWALRLRLARSTVVTATLGGAGIALLPHAFQSLDSRPASALVVVWLFALSAIPNGPAATSRAPLGEWGEIVLGRAIKATWSLWGVLLLLHVLFWTTQYRLDPAALFVVVPLVLVRWISTERRVWAVVLATLALVAFRLPGAFSATALVAAAALAMRALRAPHAVPEPKVELRAGPLPPYRHFGDEPAIEPGSVLGSIVTGPAPVADPLLAVRRLLTGSAFALYLSAWTASWTSGSFPVHALPLDVLLTAVILLGAWRLRARVALAPLAVTWAHLVMQAHVVPAPTSLLGWGAASIGLGFAVLIGSLATSWWLGTSRVAGPPKMGKMR